MAWMLLIFTLISNSSSLFSSYLENIPSALTTITVNLRFCNIFKIHVFFKSFLFLLFSLCGLPKWHNSLNGKFSFLCEYFGWNGVNHLYLKISKGFICLILFLLLLLLLLQLLLTTIMMMIIAIMLDQTCRTLLEKQGRTHKRCTLMDPHTWPCKNRTTSTNIHSTAMWGYGMSWRPAWGDER